MSRKLIKIALQEDIRAVSELILRTELDLKCVLKEIKLNDLIRRGQIMALKNINRSKVISLNEFKLLKNELKVCEDNLRSAVKEKILLEKKLNVFNEQLLLLQKQLDDLNRSGVVLFFKSK